MKRIILFLTIIGISVTTVTSCGVAFSAATIALSTASLVGHSAVLAHDLHTYVGSHRTAYSFELVDMINDGSIENGKIVYPTADADHRAEFSDDLINFTFCYKDNCIVAAFKGQSNSYLTINWNDVVMEGTQKLLWRNGNSSMSTITKAGFNVANLYVVYDSLSATFRTLPLYTSQKKADEAKLVGQTFTLNFPIINVDKVITYTTTLKITAVNVN